MGVSANPVFQQKWEGLLAGTLSKRTLQHLSMVTTSMWKKR